MSRARSNQEAFAGYRHLVESCAREFRIRPLAPSVRVAQIGAQAAVPLPFARDAGGVIPDECALALATWPVRYMRRRDSIHGGGGYGEPLGDFPGRGRQGRRAQMRLLFRAPSDAGADAKLRVERHDTTLPFGGAGFRVGSSTTSGRKASWRC